MGPPLEPGEAGLGCEREPEQGDANFCQGRVVSGPYSKWIERESSPWGLAVFPPSNRC